MILTGPEIRVAIERGELNIEPFRAYAIQPNGYDFHLARTLIAFQDELDCHTTPQGHTIEIPPEGYILEPNTLYLGLTEERFTASHHAMLLFGNQSVGSLGVWVQVSSPLGHTGSQIRWTLEIRVLKPVRLFAGMPFGKVAFLTNQGERHAYSGKYTQDLLMLSKLSEETL